MNPRLLALTVTVLGGLCGLAQQPATAAAAPSTPDAPASSAANRASGSPPTAAGVDLPSPDRPAAPDDTTRAPSPPAGDTPPPTAAEPSLTVQVETLQTGSGAIDPKSVKLLAPFPAKPLAPPPPGWRLDASASAPPFVRKVELAPGTHITLTIRPHLLIPDAAAFALNEPGFDPALGYSQSQTVSAILANSIQQLDADAKQLGTAIELLQQLVSSLPHPAPPPQPPATPTPPIKR